MHRNLFRIAFKVTFTVALFVALFVAMIAGLIFSSAAAFAEGSARLGGPAGVSAPVPAPVTDANDLVTPTKGFLPTVDAGFAQRPEAATYYEICPTVRFENRIKFKLKDMEKRLLCGDHDLDSVGQPWRVVPPNQAAYFLKGFLQARGFHEPVFIQDGDLLFVKEGEESKLKTFEVAGGPPGWDPPVRRLIKGEPLTPDLLDDLQAWALAQIKNEGYACATASIRADPLTGEALVTLKPDQLKYIKGFKDTGEAGLTAGVLDRYDAFKPGDLYRDYLVALTRKRTQDSGFLQTYVLTTKCEPDGVTLVRDVVLGPSRTVRVGVGATTDKGPIVKGSVRANRIGSSASTAQVTAQLSYLREEVQEQKVELTYRYFYSPSSARSYLEPGISYTHENEVTFKNLAFETKLVHGWTAEIQDGQFEARVGPTFLDSHNLGGTASGPLQGPSDVTVTYLQTDFRFTSHKFEYFSTSPRAGENIQSSILVATKDVGSNFTAQKFQLQGEKIWSVFRYDPPLLLLGARFNLSSIFSPAADIQGQLPPRFLTYVGGDLDLRGFDPASLPRNGNGALSAATASLEARLHKVIFRVADAFAFLDSGLLGDRAFSLRIPYLMSPGVGIRYESPIGVFRLYVAQRFALVEEPGSIPYGQNYRVGLTFGQEF